MLSLTISPEQHGNCPICEGLRWSLTLSLPSIGVSFISFRTTSSREIRYHSTVVSASPCGGATSTRSEISKISLITLDIPGDSLRFFNEFLLRKTSLHQWCIMAIISIFIFINDTLSCSVHEPLSTASFDVGLIKCQSAANVVSSGSSSILYWASRALVGCVDFWIRPIFSVVLFDLFSFSLCFFIASTWLYGNLIYWPTEIVVGIEFAHETTFSHL